MDAAKDWEEQVRAAHARDDARDAHGAHEHARDDAARGARAVVEGRWQ
jgi:hypothetical protein